MVTLGQLTKEVASRKKKLCKEKCEKGKIDCYLCEKIKIDNKNVLNELKK